ncbi:tRNA pseudouridine(55) synthase TruB [Mycoplasma flocculare]|uniref:tRNA pseudouridine synthase B n=2 Tax=Mesomycoplasma flocculare TaxID=2128 RepID=A0A0A8E7E0_MESFC|nr:tRNA pseudouridine(55) synthase TruB [Mesomycoplasma flocculare]MXR39690.1 tRNA pseudouridine(55) synthase TruB [Mycoplasma sp. MF12]AJC49904.1 tRNA pseudouridine synthase B [Mesomycoplasma flocculare ATCC 27399]ENX51240.1 tRNA pseudouridine synthase B [Mesomycoplasma flocculare ATCC 27716]MXR06134.1 tRNA pseudouridine(55) synthase TruB [Mesomycoplasma flocculare]MXR12384.1 tRNA pseudouridine(55) synthase TruB [Mesomycoplasma flocculare]
MITFLYKPKNITSANFLRKWAKKNQVKKVGHSGTLDPLASGLLLVATDDDTKLLQYLDQKTKTYLAKVQFGFWSTSLDAEGTIFPTKKKIEITKEKLIKALEELEKREKQIPPLFSSKKIAGKRAYHYARSGKEIELAPIAIKISKTDLLNFDFQGQNATIIWEVSRGCYIRALADDLGKILGTRAYLKELERTKIANFGLENQNFLFKVQDLIEFQQLILDRESLHLLFQGKKINYFAKDNDSILLIFQDEVVGFGKIINNQLISKKLFGQKIQKLTTN